MKDGKRTYVRIALARERELARLGVPQSLKNTVPLDFGSQYSAKELLELLGIHDSSPNHFVQFAHEAGHFCPRILWTTAIRPEQRQNG